VMAKKLKWVRTAGLGAGLALTLVVSGCKKQAETPAPIVDMNGQPDPAAANMATPNSNGPLPPGSASTGPSTSSLQRARVLGSRAEGAAPQSSGEQYPEAQQQYPDAQQQYPEAQQQYPEAQQQSNASPGYGNTQGYNNNANQPYAYNNDVEQGEDALAVDQAPPPLPVYQQPDLTVAGDEWTPGYWNYGSGGYYWVPSASCGHPDTGVSFTLITSGIAATGASTSASTAGFRMATDIQATAMTEATGTAIIFITTALSIV
jgi:pyruvate/2-oxoglutarate dehydrogenase complex dihydrolipoamide acyltransferase (E2) component